MEGSPGLMTGSAQEGGRLPGLLLAEPGRSWRGSIPVLTLGGNHRIFVVRTPARTQPVCPQFLGLSPESRPHLCEAATLPVG